MSVLKELAAEVGLELINGAVQPENTAECFFEISSVDEPFLRVIDKVSLAEETRLDVGLELPHF